MAPLSHLAVAVLAATSVVAAPLPTPTGSADILQPRGFIDDLLQQLNPFGKYVDDKTKVKTKDMLENALEVEKQLKGGHDKRDDGHYEINLWPFCLKYPIPIMPQMIKCEPKEGWGHKEHNKRDEGTFGTIIDPSKCRCIHSSNSCAEKKEGGDEWEKESFAGTILND